MVTGRISWGAGEIGIDLPRQNASIHSPASSTTAGTQVGHIPDAGHSH